MADCVGCGFCCRTAICVFGQMNGTHSKGDTCQFLAKVGDQWRCRLYLEAPEPLRKDMEISMGMGAGCSSSFFNTEREAVLKKLSQSSSSSPSPEPCSSKE